MSYEYNPDSHRFNLPNPHRVENGILFAAAAITLILGVIALISARAPLVAGQAGAAVWPGLAGIALLAYGLWCLWRGLSQLTFYFGREQPRALRKDQNLRETLRQNAIEFPTPKSAIDQLLYRLVPDLVFSPLRVQLRAREQFNNGLVVVVLLLCFGIALFGAPGPGARDWVAVVFFGLAVYFVLAALITPLRRVQFGPVRLGLLLALSIVGPAGLAFHGITLPPLGGAVHFQWLAWTLLGSALVANLLFLAALFRHTLRPERISMANVLATVSMNAHPRQLVVEFDREMQALWTEQIPNRPQLRVEPKIAGDAGHFSGEVLEETQPVPASDARLGFADAWRLREYRYLLLLDIYALICAIGGGSLVLSGTLGSAIAPNALLIGANLVIVSLYAFVVSNFMWRRFEFHSRAYWLQLDGNYQTSNVDYGRLIDDAVKTRKQVVNIEDMTLRVWVADLYSVSFGPDEPRDLISMSGVQDEAQRLCDHLREFAESQRVFVAPSSSRDLDSVTRLDALNQGGGAQALSEDARRRAAALRDQGVVDPDAAE